MQKTNCKACGKEIFFAINPATSKASPLVLKPVTAFVVDDPGLPGTMPTAKPVRVYLSHFGDCPAAKHFSKPKPKGSNPDEK